MDRLQSGVEEAARRRGRDDYWITSRSTRRALVAKTADGLGIASTGPARHGSRNFLGNSLMENRPPQDSPRRRIDGRKPNGSAGGSTPPWLWVLLLAFFAFVFYSFPFFKNEVEVAFSPWFTSQVETDNISSLNFQGLEAHGELRQPRNYEPKGTKTPVKVTKFIAYIPTPEMINQIIKDLKSEKTPAGNKRLPVAISGSLPTGYNGLMWLGSMVLTTLALFAFALFMMRRARSIRRRHPRQLRQKPRAAT